MRSLSLWSAALVTGLATANLAHAQQGGGFGGLGGMIGQQADPLTLLRNGNVKKELGLTDEQVAKLPEAMRKALADVLDAKQLKRLRQIELQTQGYKAFGDTKVQEELRLSAKQKESMGAILTAADEAAKDMRGGLGNFKAEDFQDLKGAFQKLKGAGEKLAAFPKEVMAKCLDVLTESQKKQWTAMLGDEFKMGGRRPGGMNPTAEEPAPEVRQRRSGRE